MEPNKLNTALLVMDMQAGILLNLPTASAVKEKVTEAIGFARSNNILIIYSVVGFRESMPEISPNNKGFTAMKSRLEKMKPEEFAKIDSAVEPIDKDIVIIKKCFSAFIGSDLEIVLRAKGIQHIVLTGVSTSGVVLSTTREAADKDYQITILSDACGDADEEVHRVLTTKVFPRQADVVTVEEWKTKVV